MYPTTCGVARSRGGLRAEAVVRFAKPTSRRTSGAYLVTNQDSGTGWHQAESGHRFPGGELLR